MIVNQLSWVIGLCLVALVIVVLNDMTKPKETQRKSEKSSPRSGVGQLIGILVVAPVIVLCVAYGRDIPSLGWILPLVLVGAVLLVPAFLLRRVIWLYLKSVVTGRLPLVIRRNADGELETRCPRCSASVSVVEGRVGETAFECPFCGEKAFWTSQRES